MHILSHDNAMDRDTYFAPLFGTLALLFSSVSLASDAVILHIRKEYQSIQAALPSLKAETIPLSGYSFNKGKMVRWLNESKNEVKSDSKEFKEAEKEVTETSNDMLSKFKRKT